MARPICLRLLVQDMRLAASRTFWTAGSKRPMRTAMMAITTSSSISVKPRRRDEGARMATFLGKRGKESGSQLERFQDVVALLDLDAQAGVGRVGVARRQQVGRD